MRSKIFNLEPKYDPVLEIVLFQIRLPKIFSAITTASVAIGGMIGWIGRITPHISRVLVESNYKILTPAYILVGSIFLLIVDNIARSAFLIEISLGILISLIGAPCFIFLILNGKKGL